MHTLILIDTEVKRFNALRKVWGSSRVLPLETFNDPKNGYIFEGNQCEFGVDVLVAPTLAKWEAVSFDQQSPNFKFSWTLKKFVELKENFYTSDEFSIGGREWTLRLYPKSDSTERKWLSIFLMLADSEELNADEKIYVLARISLIDSHGESHNVVGSKCMS
ncbi:unnamed protein product [Microthlaspi erraticum]|uniref:MATH domain-containing protein n=1 Tax=Microthlaspi erraticum TaxID=1685480 RepID=A0A6D2IMC5_9BRAS|nr:unnamed protein product [Microthlaspi erraticum]